MAHSRTRELETGKQELVCNNVESLYRYHLAVSSLIKAQGLISAALDFTLLVLVLPSQL